MNHSGKMQSAGPADIRPGRVWYIVAGFLFLVGAIGGIVVLFTSLFTSLSSGTPFVVPGEVTISVERPGTYTLWNEVGAIHDGKLYPGSSELPESLEIRITDTKTGRTIPITSSSTSKETVGSRERYAICTAELDQQGKYRIDVSGDFTERVFLIRRSVFSDIIAAGAAFLVLSLIGWIGAPILAIVVLIQRINAKRKLEPPREPIASPPPYTTGRPSVVSTSQEQTWATFCHLGAFAGLFFPFAHIIVPLVIWLIKKDEFPLVDDQGKESLNFQISMTLYYIISTLLMVVLVGFFLLAGLFVFQLIVVIVASVKANKGERYRYPLCIRFIR